MIIGLVPSVYADSTSYGYVTELTNTREYVLVWNSDIRGNDGDKHALAADSSGVATHDITAGSAYTTSDSSEVWVAVKSGDNWLLKNKSTAAYLKYDSSTKSLTVTSVEDEATEWVYKVHTAGNSLQPSEDTSMSIRYSVGSGKLQMRAYNDGNNCHVFLYEAGAKSCDEHAYKDCLSTTCSVCGTERSNSGLSHSYANGVCSVCGTELYTYDDVTLADNQASKTFSAVFYDNNADSLPTDEYANMFNITSLVASVAPLEAVTHLDINVEASNIESFTNSFNTKPSCQLFWNGWWADFVETKKFGDSYSVTFSADVPEDGVNSIWLLPFAFVPETEIAFRVIVTVTYTETSEEDYGEALATIVSFSDYQSWSGSQQYSTNWISLRAQLSDIFTTMSRVNPDYVIFGGDYTSAMLNREASDYGRAEVLAVLGEYWSDISPENGTYIQVEGNHDPDTQEGPVESSLIEYDEFLVYILNEDDLPWDMYTESSKTKVQAAANKLSACFDKLIEDGETRPVFIASHTGLHYDVARNDGNNRYTYIMFDVINEAAKKLDIIFLFGHNHSTSDPEAGGSIVFKAVGDTIYVPTEDCYDADGKGLTNALNIGRASKLNFTYFNYGYVGYIGNVKDRISDNADILALDYETVLTASEINIYEDVITLSRYSAGGKLSAFSKTIERTHTGVKKIPTEADSSDEVTPDNEIITVEPAKEAESSLTMYVIICVAVAAVAAIVIILVIIRAKKKTEIQ